MRGNCLNGAGRRIIEQTAELAGKDKHPRPLKLAITQNHQHVNLNMMKIFDTSSHNNKLKRKISEVLNAEHH